MVLSPHDRPLAIGPYKRRKQKTRHKGGFFGFRGYTDYLCAYVWLHDLDSNQGPSD